MSVESNLLAAVSVIAVWWLAYFYAAKVSPTKMHTAFALLWALLMTVVIALVQGWIEL